MVSDCEAGARARSADLPVGSCPDLPGENTNIFNGTDYCLALHGGEGFWRAKGLLAGEPKGYLLDSRLESQRIIGWRAKGLLAGEPKGYWQRAIGWRAKAGKGLLAGEPKGYSLESQRAIG